MSRKNHEDFTQIKNALRRLDEDIPVPYAASAEGLRARLSAERKPAPSHRLRKMIPALACFVMIVSAAVMFRPALMNKSPMIGRGETAEAPQNSRAADAPAVMQIDACPEETALEAAAEAEIRDEVDSAAPSLKAQGTLPGNSAFRKAATYEDVIIALDTAAAAAPFSSSAVAAPESPPSDSEPFFSLSAGSYQYTLTYTPEGQARLTIQSTQDGSILSDTDLGSIRGSLYLQDNLLFLTGEDQNDTILQVFDISDLSCPVVAKTMVQEGVFLGTWFTEDSMLVASLYHVEDMDQPIPTVNGEMLPAQRILLSEEAAGASYAVVTAVPINADAEATTFAVLGGSNVEFYAGELTISTVTGDTFTVSQPHLDDLSDKKP